MDTRRGRSCAYFGNRPGFHFKTPLYAGTNYKDPRVDQLFQQADVAPTRDEEKKAYDHIQQIVGDKAPYIFLGRPQDILATRTSVTVPDVKESNELWGTAAAWTAK